MCCEPNGSNASHTGLRGCAFKERGGSKGVKLMHMHVMTHNALKSDGCGAYQEEAGILEGARGAQQQGRDLARTLGGCSTAICAARVSEGLLPAEAAVEATSSASFSSKLCAPACMCHMHMCACTTITVHAWQHAQCLFIAAPGA
jgi:hypothetical protein